MMEKQEQDTKSGFSGCKVTKKLVFPNHVASYATLFLAAPASLFFHNKQLKVGVSGKLPFHPVIFLSGGNKIKALTLFPQNLLMAPKTPRGSLIHLAFGKSYSVSSISITMAKNL